MTHAPDALARAFGLPQAQDIQRVVTHGAELDRVLSLPRRIWEKDTPATRRLIDEMTAWLKHPTTTCTDPRCDYHNPLLPVQAIALFELYHYGFLCGPQAVGSGKTLETFLLGTVMRPYGAPAGTVGAERPVLLIPAKLREKTETEFAHIALHYRAPKNGIRIFSYQELSLDYGDDTPGKPSILTLAAPDVLGADEAHRLKNAIAACTKKVAFFMEAHPMLPFVPFTGTMCNDSILDYAHLLEWSMKAYAPVPRTYVGKRDWSYALDVNVNEKKRMEIGALLELAKPEDMWDLVPARGDEPARWVAASPLTAARRGFRRRLIETPGLVTFAEAFEGSSLYIKAVEPPYSNVSEDAFRTLRTQWKMPDGESVMPDDAKPGVPRNPMTGMQRWAGAGQLALGFYYSQEPPPPPEWSNAKLEWHQSCRRAMQHSGRQGLDSPGAVAAACGMMLPGEMWKEIREAYARWVAIRETYDPEKHKVTRWIDDGPLKFVVEWMKHAHGAIVWSTHVAFSERLAEVTGAPYYGEEGTDAKTGLQIDNAKPRKGMHAIIASGQSNSEGRNLQKHFYENLYTSCPTTGMEFEQRAGRTHRQGQPQDEVSIDIMVGCTEQAQAFWDAEEDSRFSSDSLMGVKARLHYADRDFVTPEEILQRGKNGSARWW